jgi:hypothetical protein
LYSLGQGLATVAARLEAAQAAALCGQAAAAIVGAMSKTTNRIELYSLGQGLATVAARLEAAQAAALCGKAAAAFLQAMSKTTKEYELSRLGEGLAAVAGRLEAAQAGALCGQAAAAMLEAMRKTTNAEALSWLGGGLAALAARLEAVQAAATATVILDAMSKTTDSDQLSSLGQGLAALAARLEAAQATATATAILEAISKTAKRFGTEGFSALLRREKRGRDRGRFIAVASAAGCRAHALNGFLVIAQLEPAMQTAPPPLPAQMLVDLLKHPLCVRGARRAVLDQLSRHYTRAFADQWDFVAYARRHKLDLDLTSPLPRPDTR